MKSLVSMASCLAVLILASTAIAADADPTGTWKWSSTFNNQTRESTLKLKLEDGKLTGAMVGRNDRETPIEDAKFENGKVSFKVVRERDGQRNESVYSGEVSGDTIKGTIESERGGQKRSREWEATRQK
jgi:hypothetical protein